MVTDQERTGAVPPGRQAFYDAIRPELITPLVVYLASRDCTLNHRAIAACAGRYSRKFAGYGGGWLSEGAEDVAAQVALLDSTDDFFVPESSVNETIAVCRQRAIDLSQM
jgi:hypothetical protein